MDFGIGFHISDPPNTKPDSPVDWASHFALKVPRKLRGTLRGLGQKRRNLRVFAGAWAKNVVRSKMCPKWLSGGFLRPFSSLGSKMCSKWLSGGSLGAFSSLGSKMCPKLLSSSLLGPFSSLGSKIPGQERLAKLALPRSLAANDFAKRFNLPVLAN